MKAITTEFVSILLLGLAVLGLGLQALSGKEPVNKPAELLKRAKNLSDIFSEGGTPFRLSARFSIFAYGQDEVKGTYVMFWAAPEELRQEISLPGFTEVRVLAGNKVWRLRSLATIPLRVFELQGALGFTRGSPLNRDQKTSKVKTQINNGARQSCFTIKQKLRGGMTLCFDPVSGVLVSNGNEAGGIQYSDYAPWGNKLFPRSITLFDRGERVVECHIDQLGSLDQVDPSLFVAPPGAVENPGCHDPDSPKLLKFEKPRYPPNAKRAHITGVVRAIAEVGADGRVHDAHVVSSPDSAFDPEVLDALSRWEFKPAMCKGTSVPSETELDVNFELIPWPASSSRPQHP